MNCEECGGFFPESDEDMIDWIIDQKNQRLSDEIIYGNSFMCNECGGRIDPTEVIEDDIIR